MGGRGKGEEDGLVGREPGVPGAGGEELAQGDHLLLLGGE